jgi:transcriptional regulator with XRE-family HTH domain
VATLRDLVTEALDRLRLEATEAGRSFSIRTLEADHGIANGTLGQITRGRRKAVDPPTLRKLSVALGVSLPRLIEASGAPADAPEQSPTPPPQTIERVISNPEDSALIDDAFDGSVHKPSDVDAVRAMLRYRAAFPREHADPVVMVRTWLDAAARLRRRGETATPGAIVAELTRRLVELEGGTRVAEINDRVCEDMASRGYQLPQEPPPAVAKLLGKRRRGE